MNTELSKNAVESYRENGFLVIDDFLSIAELAVRGRTCFYGRPVGRMNRYSTSSASFTLATDVLSVILFS